MLQAGQEHVGEGDPVTYRTNTLSGSSGPPCFNHGWQLVTLHHSCDPDHGPTHQRQYDEGIAFTAITALLERHQLDPVVGAQQR
jgi:V8-like Glu-specific endopeptidase